MNSDKPRTGEAIENTVESADRPEPPRKPIARVAQCNLSDVWLLVWPPEAVSKFRKSMRIEVGPNEKPDERRVGSGIVSELDAERGAVRLGHVANVNAHFPAIAVGDDIYEYEVPCTRCRCKRCDPLEALKDLNARAEAAGLTRSIEETIIAAQKPKAGGLLETDAEYRETHYKLHHLWTKAVGTAGYVKSEWKALDEAILGIARRRSSPSESDPGGK